MRFTPSGLANEIFLDTFVRLASFEPGTPFPARLFDAYKFEVGRVDQDGDGVISAVEGDIDSASDGFEDNSRLFLPAISFNPFAVTREINDGLLAPRFAPSQKAWLVKGFAKRVDPGPLLRRARQRRPVSSRDRKPGGTACRACRSPVVGRWARVRQYSPS